MSDENKKIVTEVLDSSIYATKKELNEEAKIRAESDQEIITDFTILRKTTNKKIEDINEKVEDISTEPIKEKVDDLAEKVSAAEENIKSNKDRIDNIEECFFTRIKDLETENEGLNEKLSEASRTIIEKNTELEKLREEIRNSGGENQINLTFAEPPEFTIKQVMSVKEFINNYLKEVIVARMLIRHPAAEWSKDYSLLVEDLSYNDVMQGKVVPVTIYALATGQLIGQSTFDIIVTHQYNASEQEKFIAQFLETAIPISLRNVDENASPDYNIPKEIAVTAPLKLLLNNQKIKQLTFKIFSEMNAASYWTDFHRSWQYLRDGYVGTGKSTIGADKTINNIYDLYNTTVGYHHTIYQLIEQRLNDSGVPCSITKKWVRHSRSDNMLHALGNMTFNVQNLSLESDEVTVTQSCHYYVMINFDLTLKDQTKKFYRGVTLALTDNLELYS